MITTTSHFGFVRRMAPVALLVVLVSGCTSPKNGEQSPTAQSPPPPHLPPNEIRANCFSLLYRLLQDEKNLDKLLIIKRESPELRKLVKSIAAISEEGAKRLEDYARTDSSIRLNDEKLPAGEVATRDAIAKTRKKQLLKPFEPRFEFYLLLTQIEALSYGSHLAEVAASHEPEPQRSSELRILSQALKAHYEQVLSLLAARATTAKAGT